MLISPLQKFEPKDWSGLTTENHLGALFGRQPIMVSDVIDNIFEVNLGLDLDRFMDQFPTLEIEEDNTFEWMLNSQSPFKNIPVIDIRTATGGSATGVQLGLGGAEFQLVFPDRLFEATDLIAPASYLKETYKFRVKRVTPEGSNWVYVVDLPSGDDTLYVTTSLIAAGTRFVKMFAPVEQTLSQRGSNSITHSSPFRMSNRCTMIRAEYMVPGNMIDKKENAPLGFYFVDAESKKHTTWLGKLDYDFMSQFKRQKAMMQLYATANKNLQGSYNTKGESGYEIKMGSGLYEQISPSNVHYFSTFNIKTLSDILLSLSVGKLPEDQRRFVLGTGEYGMRQFHEAVQTQSVTYGPNRTEMRFSGSMDSMKYGGQFKAYGFINGIEIELMHIPFLDDISLCAETHPDGGPLSSYEYLILDFGTSKGKPNIQKVGLKGGKGDAFRYIPGLRDPFTPTNSATATMTVSKVDGYEVLRSHVGGMKVHNPMRLARFIPNLA